MGLAFGCPMKYLPSHMPRAFSLKWRSRVSRHCVCSIGDKRPGTDKLVMVRQTMITPKGPKFAARYNFIESRSLAQPFSRQLVRARVGFDAL